MRRWPWLAAAVLVVVGVVGPPAASAGAPLPTPAHIVIVIEENKPDGAVIGNKSAPYINALANSGANMTQSFAEAHPSEPNYLALFSGSTFGLTSDACPVDAGAAPNLASELLAAGYTFAGFSEDLPAVGSPACSAGKYARKHAPWVNFTNVPAATSVPFSAFNNRQDYASLPAVSFVIPNLDNDMHDGTIAAADTWLYNNLSHYANWAVANNSLLILTFDEDDGGSKNQIPTVIYGAHVKPGSYSEAISHYNVLATIEDMYGLPRTGLAANAPAIPDVWA
jgi:phosphatidylinositol-3-phosphatase